MSTLAAFEPGGVFRCCLEAMPVDDAGRVLAGKEGEHVRCKHCKAPDSGMKFIGGRWIAAWRATGDGEG